MVYVLSFNKQCCPARTHTNVAPQLVTLDLATRLCGAARRRQEAVVATEKQRTALRTYLVGNNNAITKTERVTCDRASKK